MGNRKESTTKLASCCVTPKAACQEAQSMPCTSFGAILTGWAINHHPARENGSFPRMTAFLRGLIAPAQRLRSKRMME